jgi:hypothetical protein
VSTFQVVPSSLQRAGHHLIPGSGTLAGTTVEIPDPSMYGLLVGSAASDAEPATTEAMNDVIKALAELFESTTTQLEETGQCYSRNEEDLGDLIVAAIVGMLR